MSERKLPKLKDAVAYFFRSYPRGRFKLNMYVDKYWIMMWRDEDQKVKPDRYWFKNDSPMGLIVAEMVDDLLRKEGKEPPPWE